MPYIDPDARKDLCFPNNSGELNYLITSLCDDYLNEQGKNYKYINEIIGVLECAKLEFYRRIAAPYEIEKCALNGDVYSV